ncbi:MAG: ATP-dependent helicase [Mesorhizobium amorphae]|nr:MAG: ATP-dependent helicase [Mesorhizobium amorphae]
MSLGRLDYDAAASRWVVSDLPGHVSMRFKSVFQGIPTGSVPPFRVTDRADTAADLAWFLERYPLDASPEAAARLAAGVTRYRDARDRLELLRTPGRPAPEISGFREGTSARPHQAKAAEIFGETGSLLLLDEVGLGKSVSALAALMNPDRLPAAIIVQPHISTQWVRRYVNRFTHLRAVEITNRNAREVEEADVYVFRYSNIAAWVDAAADLGIRTVIFDEVQELRHGDATEKGRAGKAFARSAEAVMALSATPIYNYGSEIFNIVEIVRPGFLGSWAEFMVNWCVMHGNHWIVRDPSALGAYLQSEGVTLRRTEDDPDVALVIPPLERQVLEVEWAPDDVRDQRDLQKRLALRVVEGDFHSSGRAARELDMLMRQETGIAKARSVAAHVRNLVEGGEKVLLGGWHREVYRIWNREMADLAPVMYTGTETVRQKEAAISSIERGDTPVMIMSNRSGAGVDGLQHLMSQAVIGELDWAPPVHTQFVGRLRRDGQEGTVTAHYPWVNGGSDPVILATLGLKSSQSRGIVDPYGGGIESAPPDSRRARQLALRVLGLDSQAEDEAAGGASGTIRPSAALPAEAEAPAGIPDNAPIEWI